MTPENLAIILVRPQGPINIGSVCRVMMNFGFNQLRLVAPTPAFRSLEAKKMALSAFPIIEQASVFKDLPSALSDIQVAFGTTRRFGKYRKNFYTPKGAGQLMVQHYTENQCALVLGPEDTGLETCDLDLCQHFITIPTHDDYPSMNLSHSLAVLLYEIAGADSNSKNFYDPAPKKLATGRELDQLFDHMKKTLLSIDYLDPQNPDHLLRTFRRIFGAADLTSRDIRILRGLMSRIDWTENQRRRVDHVHNG
jgi:tRNA/rRNA methyltransferase